MNARDVIREGENGSHLFVRANMKTIEITLDDELHRRLMEASKATSQSFKQHP
jgi:hypothetical protein